MMEIIGYISNKKAPNIGALIKERENCLHHMPVFIAVRRDFLPIFGRTTLIMH